MARSSTWMTAAAVAVLALGTTPAVAQPALTVDEILEKISEITPKDEDFDFDPPDGWGENLMAGAAILSVTPQEGVTDSRRIIDGIPHTTWQSSTYVPRPEITIDLKRTTTTRKLVVFNRHTDSRGTGGGNNAVKELELLASGSATEPEFRSLGTFTLEGPKPVCFKKKEGGQICTFIDSTEPTVLDLPPTQCRLLKIKVKSAHWVDSFSDDGSLSVALSELLLYDAEP